jgi:transcriptional regulator with XRE-family HTH domain
MAWANLDSMDEMCSRAMASRPTLARWLEGSAYPAPSVRESIVQALERETP